MEEYPRIRKPLVIVSEALGMAIDELKGELTDYERDMLDRLYKVQHSAHEIWELTLTDDDKAKYAPHLIRRREMLGQ